MKALLRHRISQMATATIPLLVRHVPQVPKSKRKKIPIKSETAFARCLQAVSAQALSDHFLGFGFQFEGQRSRETFIA